ncbi:sh3 and f-bar domain-containing protein [Anaeramoeba flamelloides]|uniref:Sh3 and f-bar domain-containing protein n=1 Tax=Anaeramoeba flamelloides TaxID=1746091 RepID=A0AAV7ZYT5_9EUKA|nr:sh3 and f-bar domain-containing protein [Anaeramoeba flamelloides]
MSYASDLWDQYPLVKKKVDEDFSRLSSLSDFLQKCAKIQENYGKMLLKYCQSSKSGNGEYGTLNLGWESIRSEMERIGQLNIDCAENTIKECSQKLLDFRKETKQKRKEIVSNCSKKTKVLDKLRSKLKSSQSKSEKCKQVLQVAQSLEGDKKKDQKVNKAQKNSDKAENELETAQSNFDAGERDYYSTTIPEVLSEFQTLELDRSDVVQTSYSGLVTFYKENYISKLTQIISRMETSVQEIDKQKDVEAFSSEHKSGNQPPTDNNKSSISRTTTTSNTTSTTTISQPKFTSNTTTTNINTNTNTINKEEETTQENNNDDEAEICDIQVVAIYDYEAKDETDLGFSQGDSIRVVKKHSSGWWEGECNGQRGLFPMNFVSENAEDVESGESGEIDVGDRVQALYDYQAEGSGELSLAEGDVLVITALDDGWYVGYIENGDGTEGSFPGNYIEKI